MPSNSFGAKFANPESRPLFLSRRHVCGTVENDTVLLTYEACSFEDRKRAAHDHHSHARRVCRRIRLCGPLCDLCASVVSVFLNNSTTETQRITEFAQRNLFPRQGS